MQVLEIFGTFYFLLIALIHLHKSFYLLQHLSRHSMAQIDSFRRMIYYFAVSNSAIRAPSDHVHAPQR